MVYEDYRLDNKVFDVVLSYKISKRFLQDLPADTPPVIIDNSRQLHTFLGQLKRDTSRLCVEVKKKIRTDSNQKAHTCSVTERSMRARQADHNILGELYKDFVGGVGPKMDYWKAYRTLRHARELVRGSPESGYEQLPTYLYMRKRANPGNFTQLEVDEAQRFKYCFLGFGAIIQGFPFLRKVVVVDGTFLQRKYLGTLLTSTAQDGNFQIFPIAFTVVDTENDESWEWFFKQLSCVIPDDESLSIISDMHQSIGKAIKKVYPKSSRGICTYHIYKNILVRFKGRAEFALVKKAANSCRLIDFQTTFDQIEAMNPALHEYLVRADVHMWTRVHFPGDR
ncbi:PREDICTED: uncharacterized protein LOC104751837 [Camelina sativa]|uniref:Uncharacterized protein LOC104751837 n=1 Tax=Camelina sativa TaxID=90675 RepID=A0ABM0WK10_CAMSA|nr:PREDICTED: uncharacterized protein LOC104751837 [Camelina sativa]